MKIYCPCDAGFEIEHQSVINVDEQPSLLEKIMDGSFLTFKCPQCGQMVKTELKTRIEWPSKKTTLLFVPEAERFACLSFCAGLKQIDLETKKELQPFRVNPDETPVIGYRELSERIKLIQAGLDVCTVEVLKLFILEQGKEIEGKNIKFFFHSMMDDGGLQFYIYGLRTKKDEVAVMNIPRKLYDSAVSDIQNGKTAEVLKAVYLGNYISYQNIFVEGRE